MTPHQKKTLKTLKRIDFLLLNGNLKDAKELAKQVSRQTLTEYYAHQIEKPEAQEIVLSLLSRVNKIKG